MTKPVTTLEVGHYVYDNIETICPVSFDAVVEDLVDGKTVHVHVEPNDGTRYEFYLIPCWVPGLEVPGEGIPRTSAHDYLYLGGISPFIRSGFCQSWPLYGDWCENQVSNEFLRWWLMNLWTYIGAERERQSTGSSRRTS